MPGATRLTHLKVEVQADFHQGPTLIDTGQAFKQSVSICQHCKHEEYKVFILVVSAVREDVAAFQSSEILIRCCRASRYRHRRLFPMITQLLSLFPTHIFVEPFPVLAGKDCHDVNNTTDIV